MNLRMLLLSSFIALTCVLSFGGCKQKDADTSAPTSTGATSPTAGAADPNGTAQSAEVRVAAAADLKFALDQLVTDFHKTHPEIGITPTYGASGTLFAQLSNNAPFDLFLSADIGYPKKLIQAGLAPKGTEFRYARGRIVIWVQNQSTLKIDKGLPILSDPAVLRIAIANPDTAPYGRAAVAAMKKMAVYEKIKDRLVIGENIAQAAQFVQSGSADVGIIAESLAVSPGMKPMGRFHVISPDAYPAIEQGGIILPTASNPKAAQEFKKFLTGPDGQAVLKQSGYASAEE